MNDNIIYVNNHDGEARLVGENYPNCPAYRPYKLVTAEEQMGIDEVLQKLDELRCMYLGKPYAMALGIAINRIKKQLEEQDGKDEKPE